VKFEKGKYYLLVDWIEGRTDIIFSTYINNQDLQFETILWYFIKDGNEQMFTEYTKTLEEYLPIKEGFDSPEELKEKYPEHFI
jgi:hypothetical protein